MGTFGKLIEQFSCLIKLSILQSNSNITQKNTRVYWGRNNINIQPIRHLNLFTIHFLHLGPVLHEFSLSSSFKGYSIKTLRRVERKIPLIPSVTGHFLTLPFSHSLILPYSHPWVPFSHPTMGHFLTLFLCHMISDLKILFGACWTICPTYIRIYAGHFKFTLDILKIRIRLILIAQRAQTSTQDIFKYAGHVQRDQRISCSLDEMHKISWQLLLHPYLTVQDQVWLIIIYF